MWGMIWVALQRFGTVIISFVSNIVLARLLTPDDFGYVGILMVFIAVSNVFVDGGFGSALIQKTNPTQEDYTTVFYWNIALSIILYCILYLLSPLIAGFYDMKILSKILRVQGIILIINACTSVQFNILRKQMQFKIITFVYILSSLVSVILAIIFAYLGYGVWALVLQQIFLSIVNMLLLFFIMPWRPSMYFSFLSLKNLFNFGSFILLSNLINTLANNISALIVGKFFSAGSLGYLSQAQKIENVASNSIATTVEQVTYPLLVEVKNDYKRMAQILRIFNLALMAVVLPLMLSIIIAAVPVIHLLFGVKWLPSAPILKILCVAGIFICLQGSSYNVIAAIGKSNMLFRWTIIKRGVGIAVIIIGLITCGFKGVLWGMACSSCFIWLCNVWLVSKTIGYDFLRQVLDLCPVVIPTLIIFGLISLLSHFTVLGHNDVACGAMFVFLYSLTILFNPHSAVSELRENIQTLILRRR